MKFIVLFLLALASNAFALDFGGDKTINTAVSGSYSGAHADAYARK